MIKQAACAAGVAAMISLSGVATASAADDRDCSDFASPIIIVNGFDPDHLDADGDGIGCESNPGEPTTSDLYADLRGDDPTLAATGGNIIERHPIRAYGAAGLLVLGGAATVIVVRRRTRED
jgi:hypothetical protein